MSNQRRLAGELVVMAGRTRRRPIAEEERRITLRIPADIVDELDLFLDNSSPPLSRNVWIVEAIKTELERAKRKVKQ